MESSDGTKEKDKDTLCGVFGYYPEWLQFFASKKTYVILFGLVGMNQLAIGSYVIATITTLEKRFKIPSQTSGVILGGWDIGTIFSSITMAYIGSQGHKTRWVALGTFLVSIACYSQLLSYYIYGPGADAINIANQNNTNALLSSSLCGQGALHSEDCQANESSSIPPVLMFMSQFLLGVGTSMYWTLGIAYLDDNAKKNKVPMLLAISSTIRLFGSPIGFWVAAKCLEWYADPSLSPPITNSDPRWIGAWWLGWIPFGITATFFSFLLTLFPRVLPRASMRMKKLKAATDNNSTRKTNVQGFFDMLKRLFKNPLLICNTFGYVFYMFGVNGYWTFMPKYMETQFHMTASDANKVTGTVGLISAAFGVILSGVVVTKFKPSGRKIAACNFIVEALGVISVLFYAHLGCHGENIKGSWQSDGCFNLTTQCSVDCGCGGNVPYEPVCHVASSTTFFSPCHAGCMKPPLLSSNGTKIFPDCLGSCLADGYVAENMQDSICPVDCSSDLQLFLALYWIESFLSSFSHSALVIIQFRTVAPEDKSVSIALSEMMCSLITYIPSPIFYGFLLDKACMVWESTCGVTGNCWLYYGETLRYYLNYTAAVFLAIALVFDFGIWKYSKGLELYEDEEEEGESCEDNTSTKSKLLEVSGGENIELKASGT